MAAEHQQKQVLPASNRGDTRMWVDLFRKSSKPCTAFQLRKWNAEDRAISKDDLRALGFCLVAYVLGRFPGKIAVEKICRTWNVECSWSLHDNGWLIFRFGNEIDREQVLRNGPYETSGTPWLLKKLPQFFNFNDVSFSSIPTWIRLQGLPLECWTENALGKLASFVGEPLAVDDCTAAMAKTSFARILVEVDINKPLAREIRTQLPDGSLLVQAVLYEREPRLCSFCSRIGHTEGHCRSITSKTHMAARNLRSPITRTEAGNKELQRCVPNGAAGRLVRDMQLRINSAEGAALSKEVAVELADLQGASSSSLTTPMAGSQLQKQLSTAKQQIAEAASKQANKMVSSSYIGPSMVIATSEGTLLPGSSSPKAAKQQQQQHMRQQSVQLLQMQLQQQQQQQRQWEAESGNSRRLTRSASAMRAQQLQHGSAECQQGHQKETQKGKPRLQHSVDTLASTSQASKQQQYTELQASPLAPAIAVALGSPKPVNKGQRMVDLQGKASNPAIPSAATQLQNLEEDEQLMDETEIQAPNQPQEPNSAATLLAAEQVREKPSVDVNPGQPRRHTRNSSANNDAVGSVLLRQSSQQDLMANPETTSVHTHTCAMLYADQAESQAHSDSNAISMSKQQKCQNKWQTMKTRSSKKKRR